MGTSKGGGARATYTHPTLGVTAELVPARTLRRGDRVLMLDAEGLDDPGAESRPMVVQRVSRSDGTLRIRLDVSAGMTGWSDETMAWRIRP